MKKYSTRLRIIYIGDSWGFNEDTYPIIREVLNSFKDCQWTYSSPSPFYVYLKSDEQGKLKADKIIEEMRKLKTDDERFSDIKIGMSEGEVVGEFDEQGNLLPHSHPIGAPMSEAMRMAT